MTLDLIEMIEDDLGKPVRKSLRWLMWNCPFHADRVASFAVRADGSRWFCFGCRKGGDAMEWLKEYRKMTVSVSTTSRRPKPPTPPVEHLPPSEMWQARARLYIQHWEKMLWSERGKDARRYLNERGLNDDTLKRFHLGYNLSHLFEGGHLWGLPSGATLERVFLSAGVVIPWIVDGTVWKVNVRRFGQEPKYLQIRGSQPALFGAEHLAGKAVTFLVEGEFDAMLLNQEAGDLVGVGTFGSASIREIDYRWISRLLGSRQINIVGDRDQAGRDLMTALSGFSHRFRCAQVPSGKDVTEFWQGGGDLRAWVDRILND